ncbi:apolipoprotein N-acyltransferase [Variovorax sp. PAMC 28711]|uniref:apolipoprotein N-acyltransferase n=1 Tax=Variovorax sp. PAMC 28711 TaxID=1795631 RepID=UPI0009EBF092|nr:apolipoprotein N-acyltransferase [Variovorax sp. PAMC 28711]
MNKTLPRLAGFAVAGLAQALSIAAPWNGQPLWWLQILSLAFLVWQLDAIRQRAEPNAWRRGLGYGWVFTTAWLCGTFWWLFISLHTYGGLAAPLAVIAVFALAAGLALYYATACACFVAFAPAGRAWSALFFAALWTVGELLRNSWFTGFPWGAGGYAHVEGPLAPAAAWVGVYGMGALSAAIAAALAMTVRRTPGAASAKRLLPLAGVVAMLLVPTALKGVSDVAGDATLARGKLGVALLQGNIPQDEKFIPGGGVATALRWYGEQLGAPRASLTITPETAIPLLPSQLPNGYLQGIAERYSTGQQAAIVGLPIGNGDTYSNAVLGFQPGQTTTYRYDKHHLVPFGEFVPSVFRWFTNLMNIPLGDFRSGGLGQAPFLWQGQRIAPNICYEDLFGDEIGANFRDDASAPTLLLNVSNIAWFGDSIAIDQHLSISRMRSLEFARPMVRATNTGATVVIDHHGRVTHQLPRLTRGVLEAEVEGRAGRTPFARWVSTFGLWPLWIASLLVIGATIALSRRRR